jgi:hypothetical protein
MEGGSPAAIWERWTIPMYRAQQRYWGDHPRFDQMAAAYLKLRHKKTPPPDDAGAGPAAFDWSELDRPLPELTGPATPFNPTTLRGANAR